MPLSSRTAQRGGFFIGAIVGLLIGLAVALGVALYVTKVPVPFIDKVPQRTAEQDAAEAEKNKNWDPNAGLAGRNPARPATAGSAPPGAVAPAPVVAAPAPAGPPPGVVLPPPFEPSATAKAPATAPHAGASTPGAVDAFSYYVQVGAYARTDEAEAQRAKLAIQGFESKISEREQAGKVVYRVRVGPFSQRADAEATKGMLDGAGMESALVRVQK